MSRRVYETSNEALARAFSGADLHGGPPLVFMPELQPPAYLGVFHYFENDSAGNNTY